MLVIIGGKLFCRLPQDIYQTAKVSKLLLVINIGKGNKYNGKTLDEIELSDDLNIDCDEQNEKNNQPLKSSEMSIESEKSEVQLKINTGTLNKTLFVNGNYKYHISFF